MYGAIEPPSLAHLQVSALPRFLLHSEAVGWSGAFFADVQPAIRGSIEHEHQRICMWHNAAGFRARASERGPWQVVPPGVKVWVPGDKQLAAWQFRRQERAQVLLVTTERIEAILDRPFHPRALAAWYGGPKPAPHITAVVRALCADLAAGSPSGPLAGDALIVALVGYLAAEPDRAARTGGLSPAARRRLIEYIDGHLTEPLSLAELAAVARMSVRHLNRAFRITTGESPHQYVLHQRVERARRLIQAGATSLAEIASRVGFADQSRLTHAFKRVVGVTPAYYRSVAVR